MNLSFSTPTSSTISSTSSDLRRLRILFITNFYPPFELGGWEQLVHNICQQLESRGHETAILTSNYRRDEVGISESNVYRLLNLESSDLNRYRPQTLLNKNHLERENWQYLDKVKLDFNPDVVFFHSMWNLPRSLAWHAEQILPGRVAYYMAGDWPFTPSVHQRYLQDKAGIPLRRISKQLLASIPLSLLRRERLLQPVAFEHVACVSEYIRHIMQQDAGIPLANMTVIYNGIELDQFSPPDDWHPGQWKHDHPKFLYVGSLLAHKGVDVAIAGFARWLNDRGSDTESTLSIIGSGQSDFEDTLRQQAQSLGVASKIKFLGRVDRSYLPNYLRDHDVFIFPSTFNEPLARAMQEALACGLVLVGTTTGGSKELLVDDVTGLAFTAGDAVDLSCQLQRIVDEPELRQRLALGGHAAVVNRFGLERMIDEIEQFLVEIIGTSSGHENSSDQ